MNTVYLLIGGNIGNRKNNIETAANLLELKIGKITRRSSVYETGAWGNTDQPDFLNQVLVIQTNMGAAECMQQIFSIENDMGRIRTEKNAPRIIDIDILFFNDEIISEPGITIPHPQIQNRKFVLVPMNELSPRLVHPVLNKSIHDLLSLCDDPLEVKLLA
jgi:2-amino-4-hydroxy-6-hydroxymethyldihydropteridine diphosphokinase